MYLVYRVVAVGWLQGGLCEERPGLRHGGTQLPGQGTAELLRASCVTLMRASARRKGWMPGGVRDQPFEQQQEGEDAASTWAQTPPAQGSPRWSRYSHSSPQRAPCQSCEQRSQEQRGEVEPGKGQGEREHGLAVVFCFSPSSKSFLVGNKLIFPKFSLFCPGTQLVSDLPFFNLPHELFHLAFSSVLLRERLGECLEDSQHQPATSNKIFRTKWSLVSKISFLAPLDLLSSCSHYRLPLYSFQEFTLCRHSDVHICISCSYFPARSKHANATCSVPLQEPKTFSTINTACCK